MKKRNGRTAAVACTLFSFCILGLYTKFLFSELNINERELTLILGSITKFDLFDFRAFED